MPEPTTIDVPATLSGLASLLTTFRTVLTDAGVAAPTQRNVHAAVDELVANVIEYGGGGASPHFVRMDLDCDADRIVVELVDNGAAFDPMRHEAGPVLELQRGGIGIQLARHWVDELRYERRGDENHVSLIKRR